MAGMRWILPALVTGLLLLAGCGTTAGSDSPDAGSAPIGTGKVADYDFSGTTHSGEAFNGTTLKGKPTLDGHPSNHPSRGHSARAARR